MTGDEFVLQDYTVTVSGVEREDGHAPFTYVVTAPNWQTAVEYALHAHVDGAPPWRFLGLRIESTEVGVPGEDCGYAWNDYRPKKAGNGAFPLGTLKLCLPHAHVGHAGGSI